MLYKIDWSIKIYIVITNRNVPNPVIAASFKFKQVIDFPSLWQADAWSNNICSGVEESSYSKDWSVEWLTNVYLGIVDCGIES